VSLQFETFASISKRRVSTDFPLKKGGSPMSTKERFDFLESNAAILESISTQYGIDSKEYAALKNAGIALSFVVIEEYERFKKFLADFDEERDLTPEESARLIEMGIDPDVEPESS
jgi:hypothetical protein